MHTMKSNWMGRGNSQPRLIGMMLAVLVSVTSYGWADDVKPSVTSMGDLPVNVGESVRIEVVEASQVALAEPSIADAVITSKKEILVNGKKPGVTTLNVWEASGAQKTFRIVVSEGEYPSKTIRDAINLPDVHPRVVGSTVILEGSVVNEREQDRAVVIANAYREKVVNLLEVSNPVQVQIRVQVAEVRLSMLKNKGMEYPDSITYTMDLIGENVLNGTPLLGNGKSFATILHGLSSTSTGTLPGAPNTVDAGVFARINMLERNGDLQILASPTLVTLSGKEASFLAGGEFPVVIALANSFSVEYKEFGVKMKIKPSVDSKDNINTTINAELSAIDPTLSTSSSTLLGGVSVPGLTTRRAATTLQLKDGQTIMIGGLLDHATVDALRKVPGIGNVPILGKLFTTTTKDHQDKELIFLTTFNLVRNPTEQAKSAPVSDAMKKLLTEPPPIKAAEHADEKKNAKGN